MADHVIALMGSNEVIVNDETRTLGSYGVTAGATIYMVLRL